MNDLGFFQVINLLKKFSQNSQSSLRLALIFSSLVATPSNISQKARTCIGNNIVAKLTIREKVLCFGRYKFETLHCVSEYRKEREITNMQNNSILSNDLF